MDQMNIRGVHEAIQAKETGTFGPFKAFLVNFEANIEFPQKFYYHGCTRQGGSGRACCKTVEGLYACPHITAKGQDVNWTQMYRFDVFLVDGSIGTDCPPLRAAVFQAAADLIGRSPHEFSLLPDFEQFAIVHAMTTKMHEIECCIRLKEHGGQVSCSIQSLVLLGDDDFQILHLHQPTFSTPKRNRGRAVLSPSVYHTPRSSNTLSGAASSSSPAVKVSPSLNVVKA